MKIIKFAIMNKIMSQTGFNNGSSNFDTTGVENPYYETSSIRNTLIEQMKNNVILVKKVGLKKSDDIEKEKENQNSTSNS